MKNYKLFPPEGILPWLTTLFNTGYHSGHDHTVEGVYTHVHPQDMDSYHEDLVTEWLENNPHPLHSPSVSALVDALEEISDPIRFMQERLEEGESLSGMAAVQLAKDASYLRGIVRAALATYRSQGGDA